MRPLSREAARQAGDRKRAAESQKMAVAKKPRASGPSVGAPSAAARPPPPKVSAPPLPASVPRDRSVEADSPPSPPPPATSGPVVPREATQDKGKAPAGVAPTTRKTPGGSSSQGGPEPPRGSSSISDHRTSVTREVLPHGWIYHIRTGKGDSALQNPVVAREMMRVCLHPRDLEGMRPETVKEAIDGVFPTFNKTLHEIFTMRAFLVKYVEHAQALESEVNSARERALKAERERDQATQLREGLASQLKDKEAALKKGRAEAAEFDRKLDFSESQRQVAVSRGLAFEESAKAAESRAKAAEARAKTAEEKARAAEEKARAAEERAQAAEERAQAAEKKALAAEEKAERAVEQYKESDAFEADTAEAGADSYNFGYDDCLEKAIELYPGLDFSRLRPVGAPAAAEGQEEGEIAPVTDDDGDEVVEIPAPVPAGVTAPVPPAADGDQAPAEEQLVAETPSAPTTAPLPGDVLALCGATPQEEA